MKGKSARKREIINACPGDEDEMLSPPRINLPRVKSHGNIAALVQRQVAMQGSS